MKKFMAIIIMACLLLSVLAVGAWGRDKETGLGYNWSGNVYLKASEPFRAVYIIGAIDGLSLGGDEDFGRAIFKQIKGMTPIQLMAIVDKFMKDNPREWNQPMATIIIMAINDLKKRP